VNNLGRVAGEGQDGFLHRFYSSTPQPRNVWKWKASTTIGLNTLRVERKVGRYVGCW